MDIKSLITDKVKESAIDTAVEKIEDYIQFLERIKDKQTIYLENKDIGFVDKNSMLAKRNGYSFSYREANFFRSSMDLLFQKLQKATATKMQTIILRRRKGRVQETF